MEGGGKNPLSAKRDKSLVLIGLAISVRFTESALGFYGQARTAEGDVLAEIMS